MVELEVLEADVTKLEVDAIANAANTQLKHGGGVAGAIARAGGFPLEDAARLMVDAVRGHSARSLERVIFAVHGDAAASAFRRAVQA